MKQGQKTKNIILEASNKSFYEKGYDATSFGDIVKITGLSKGNITYHFKTKKDIVEAIITRRTSELDTIMQVWESQSSEPKERLYLFCQMLINEKKELQNYGCPLGTMISEFAKNNDTLHPYSLVMFEHIISWCSEQYILMHCSKKEAKTNAMRLLSRLQGIALVGHTFRDMQFIEDEVKVLQKEFL